MDHLIERYTDLERSIRKKMEELFSGICGMCTACCCRADICEEATQSAFLSLLLEKQDLSEEQMDERYGWLDLHGCSLKYGRPPVCYSYYCDELLARLPNDEARLSAKVLGNLIFHIGRDALGKWHLVEIMNPKDLEKINLSQIFQCLEEAERAYAVIEDYLQSGRLSLGDRNILEAITTETP
ncbi:hypothetical protein P4B35_00375 [Pontiellaceae bacterium B12227]|nr:hypothetical protein [Pontiellaceae bacterium B12227]